MKTFTRYPSRVYLALLLKIIITTLWLLCIASAAFSSPVNTLAGPTLGQNPSPATQSLCSGATVVFTVGSVTGNGTITVQWQVSKSGAAFTNLSNGAPYSGVTTATLTITNIQIALNDTRYRVVATDANGTTTSTAAAINVGSTPSVNTAFTSEIFCVGSQVNKSVDFFSNTSYQWQVSADNGSSWSDLSDADGNTGSTTNNFISVPVTVSMNGYLYRYTAKDNPSGCTNTSPVLESIQVLTKPVFPGASLPTPSNAFICPGGNVTFADSATGGAPIAYQWQIRPSGASAWTSITDDATYSGSTSKYLQITNFPAAAGSVYQVHLVATYPSSQGCEKGTNNSSLTVRTLPAVAVQPLDVTVCAGVDTAFKVTSSGSTPYTYQWQTDNGTGGLVWANTGTTTTSSTSSRLPLRAVTSAMNGWQYRVTISNACSPSATSQPKTLTVITGGVCSVLPLQLQSFNVQKTGSAGADISWKIDPQYAIKYFSVQRSVDGDHYMSIGQVNGERGKTSYGFTDNTPGSGTVYYRLQIINDHDETVFSPVQKLQLAMAGMAQLRPSVTTASATSIYVSLAQQSAVSVYLTDITGQVRLRQTTSLSKGEHQLPLSIGELGTGVYFVHVSDGKGNTSVLTLMKQ